MSGPTPTATSTYLLIGLKDARNDQVWSDFVERYRPVLVAFGIRLGLKQADAEEAAQESLLDFFQAYVGGRYDREQGRLRNWLLGIARNKVLEKLRKLAKARMMKQPAGTSSDWLAQLPDEASMSEIWEAQWRQAVIKACLLQIRNTVEPSTLRAFELLVFKELPPEEVARQLQSTVNAVMKSKRRVLSFVREIYRKMEQDW